MLYSADPKTGERLSEMSIRNNVSLTNASHLCVLTMVAVAPDILDCWYVLFNFIILVRFET